MIALGVIAAVWLFGRRLEERALAKREVASQIALWAVLAGVVGRPALPRRHRLAPLRGPPRRHPKVWQGGLGIPGGLIAGIPVGMWIGQALRPERRRRGDVRGAGDPARPGDRTLGELVQPGVVRPGDRPAVGVGDRRPSTCPTGYDAAAPPSTRRSSTSRCGTSGCAGCCCGSTGSGRLRRGGLLAVYVMRLRRRAPAGWRASASTPPTRSAGSGSTSGWRSRRSSAASAYLVWVARSAASLGVATCARARRRGVADERAAARRRIAAGG